MTLDELQHEVAALSLEERARLTAFLQSLDRDEKSSSRGNDPLFRPRRLFDQPGPGDTAARHDDYLYEAGFDRHFQAAGFRLWPADRWAVGGS